MCIPAFVGTHGRREADAATVDMLDAVEVALRRLTRSERRRLYRRLDKGVTEGFTPAVFASMLAELPREEVRALEAWVVDEGGMSEAAARRLFSVLLQATAAKHAVCGVGESLAGGADALWAGISEDFARDDENGHWVDWLQGRQPSTNSPRDSLAGESTASSRHTPRLSVVTKSVLAGRRLASEAEERRRAGEAQPGGYPAEDSQQSRPGQSERRSSCQLHCPAPAFLWSDAPKAVPPIVNKTSVDRASLGEQFGL